MGLAKLDLVFFSFFLCHLFLLLNPAYSSCQKPFRCGNFTMEFPFSHFKNPGCGLIMVHNCGPKHEHPRIATGDPGLRYNYTILNMLPPNKLVVQDHDLQYQLDMETCYILKNVTLSKSPIISSTISSRSLTSFMCYNQTSMKQIDERFANYTSKKCGGSTVYYRTQPTDNFAKEISGIAREYCPMIQLPMKSNQDKDDDLFKLLEPEFSLEWNVTEECSKCYHGGGECVSSSTNEFQCKYKEDNKVKLILIIAGSVAALLVLLCSLISYLVWLRKKRSNGSYLLSRNISSNPSSKSDIVGGSFRRKYPQKIYTGNEKDIELFLKNNGNLAPLRYNYSEIKKMTKSFSENLGKGGYGSVYKGKLPDGRLVAVKILKETQGNGEEFMNEVASISRTSHVNIVSLFGFCFERSKRALIYEFMPNGSLEKFIHTTSSLLEWKKLFEIAVGIARGLEYLHQGCNTRILHFDIKPHNILLDKDFNPRISDFGLAKLCPNRSSIVSMLVARGTIGYIAPEVFCRNFGEVSHKSDVYSYGMMVLEIATGGKKTVDPRDVDHSSEAYFPHYIYKQLEREVDIDCSHEGIVNEDESRYAKRKLTIVGLWCVRTDPRDRPSMTKVVEMLEGKLESLQVPPEPCLSSPPRSALSFSASESV